MSAKTPVRRDEDDPALPAPWWRQRWSVLFVGVVVLLILLIALAGKSSPLVLNIVFAEGSLLALWLLSARGWGSFVPLATSDSLRGVTKVAIGIGIISLLESILGWSGLLHRPIAFAIVLAGIAMLLIRLRTTTRQQVTQWFAAAIDWEWLWLLALPLLAAAIVAALVPPGALWGDEPHGYDVLEYHLQLPREWLELGRIAPLHHNVFSYFPLNVEMHYLLAMQLKGGPWAGMYLAQLMHVAMIVLTVAAVYATARTFASKPAAMLAALAAASTPWMLMLAPVAYNEGGLLLFAALAVGWLMQREASSRQWLIAGALAGFACGVKLTAVPLLLLIAPALALLTIRAPRPFHRLTAYLIAGAITFSPWLIRNTIWTGNPVFPEAQSILGRAHFTPEQTERWRRAHSPTEKQRSISARMTAAKDQIIRDYRFGYALLPAGIVVAVITIRRPQSRFVLALLLAWLIFWLGFTHLQGRFFVLAIPVAAMALAAWHPAIAIVPLITGMVVSLNLFVTRVAPLAADQALAFENFKPLLSEDAQMVLEKEDADIALAGDAKAFLYQVPTPRLHYRTVFDVSAQPGDTIVSSWLGQQSGSPYIIVDPFELQRFHEKYYAIPPLGDDFVGPRDRIHVLMPAAR